MSNNVKSILAVGLATLAIISCMLFILVFVSSVGSSTKEYALVTTVVEINGDEVICVDYNGNEWAFDGADDWDVGDIVGMVMDDQGTESIYDDVIVNIKYNGRA